MSINDWSFLFVISTILLTPGPTNTLLASAGISVGLRRSVSLLPFECLGYLCATSIWGLVLNTVVDDYPVVISLIKIISGLYIAKLGWNLWHQTVLNPEETAPPAVRAPQLFLATLMNPKAVILAMALFPVQTWLSVSNYAGVMSRFIALVAVIGGLWIAFGAALMSGKVRWMEPRMFQRLAALTLYGFSAWLLFNCFFG